MVRLKQIKGWIRNSIVIAFCVSVVGYVVPNISWALTDEEILKRLDERFVSGEISEKAYYELKAKYEGKEEKGTAEGKALEEIPGNLIKNSSFEEEAEGKPSHWQIVKQESGIEIGSDNGMSHSGGKSLFLSFTQPTTGEVSQEFAIEIEGGKTYILSCWIKSEGYRGSGALHMPCYYTPGTPKYKDWIMIPGKLCGGTKDWGKFETKLEIPSPVKKVKLKIISEKMTGKLWIDDISFSPSGTE